MRNRHVAFAASWLLMALSTVAVAGPEFEPYESRTPQIYEGQGGERKTVDGVDFWMRGEPPRRYQFLGSLTDERHKSGLWGLIRMSSFESDMAAACKAAGGDAVILDDVQDEVTAISTATGGSGTFTSAGGTGSANWFGGGLTRPVKEQHARFLVVKYLPDVAPPNAPSSAATAAPASLAPPVPSPAPAQ